MVRPGRPGFLLGRSCSTTVRDLPGGRDRARWSASSRRVTAPIGVVLSSMWS
jgi:hypothetical protein